MTTNHILNSDRALTNHNVMHSPIKRLGWADYVTRSVHHSIQVLDEVVEEVSLGTREGGRGYREVVSVVGGRTRVEGGLPGELVRLSSSCWVCNDVDYSTGNVTYLG